MDEFTPDPVDGFDAQDPAAAFLAREQHQLAGLEDDLEPIGAGGAAPPPAADDGADILGAEPPPSSRDSAPSPSSGVLFERPHVERVEPEKIRKWREDQQLRLEQKDAEEEVKKLEMREVAKKELQDWYTNHEEQIGKTKAANRSAEKQFVAESDEMEPGTEWERIAKLCDFNPKSAKSSNDVSRMRSIILQLKQTGLTTPKKA